MSETIDNEVGATEPMMIEVQQVSQQQAEGALNNQQNIVATGIDSNIGNESSQQRQQATNSNAQHISEIITSSQKDQEEDKKDHRDNPFEKDRYLDVKDYLGDWRVGIVQNVIDKQMKAHIQFDGCSSKQDDFISVNSNRFTQFRRYTKGYTGEKNSAIRFRRNIEDIQRMISEFTEMEKHEFKGVSAVQYNQHARGKYFFGVDQALQNISYEGNAAFQVLELIQNHIKYVIRYILKFPSLFNDYQKGCSGNDSQFTDISIAISFGYFEVFQLLLVIFGTSDRLVTNPNCFYAKNWRLIRAEKNKFMSEEHSQQFVEVTSSRLLESDSNSDMPLEEPYIGRTPKELLREKILQEIVPIFINCFWQQGGYAAILSLFNSPVSKLIPLEALLQILKIIAITLFKANFNHESMRTHCETLIESSQIYTAERLTQSTEKEIREYDGNLFRRIREKLQEIVKYHHDSAVVDDLLKKIDIMELNVALKLLTSSYLNRKIQGLNDISEVIGEIKHNQNIYNNQAYNNHNMHNLQGYSDFCSYDQLNDRKINAKEFTEWIIANNIIDHLLGDSLHVEIIRRCHEILRFMCAYQQFPVGLIDTIWNSCGADTHEAIVSAIFDMIIQISDQLSRSALRRVHEKINSIPLSEVTEQTLHLLRGFSQKAIQRLVSIGEDNNNDADLEENQLSSEDDVHEKMNGRDQQQLQEETESYSRFWSHPRDDKIERNFFCLGYLWRIIQESQLTESIPTVIAEGALAIVKDIFGMSQGYKVVRKYAGLCLDQLSSGKSSYQVYFILAGVFDNHYGSDLLTELLETKTNLPHMIVNETYNYITAACKTPAGNSQSLTTEATKTSLSNSSVAVAAAPNIVSPLGSTAANAAPSNQPQHLEQLKSSGKFSHEANIHVRLALLETVLCKTELDGSRIFALSPEDFDLLWKAFITQPNHPGESELFINWIYRKIITKQTTQAVYYGQQTDIAHLFTIDLMKHIFLNVFCENSSFDLAKLSNELFAIFLYLFKKINLKAKAIEFIQGTQKYKVIKEELLGQDTMWKIFRLAEDKQVISSCCDQLSEMYLNHVVSWENSETSEKYLRLITNLCMELLQEGFEREESSLIDRSVALLNLFFLKFEGEPIERQYKQLLERQYSQYGMQVVTFTFVLANENNSKKEIKFNSNTPFGLIRRKVAQEFGLPASSFRLFCRATKQFVETYEDEESRQLQQNSYVLHMVQGADLENAFHPKNFIIQNDQYFDLLFSVLSVNFCSEECHNNLWELILKLPQNEHIKQSILKVEEPWNEIFKGSFHKKLYCLNILHDILTSNIPQFPLWFQKFVASSGYQYLHQMVADLDVSMIQNALSKKYVLQLLKVITLFFKYFQNKEQLEGTEEGIRLQERCFERIVQCIHRVCEYAIEREQKDLENSAYEKEAYFTAQNHHFRALQAAQNNNNNAQQQQQQLSQSEPKPPEFFQVEKDMILSALFIINNNHLDRLLTFFTHPLIESILWKGLSQMDNILAKQFLCQTMEYLFNFCKEKSAVLKYLLPVVLDTILPKIVAKSISTAHNEKIPVQFSGDRSALFFKFACHIIAKSDESVEYDFEQSTIRLAQMEIDRPVVEMSQSDKDEILIGIMSILKEQLVLSKSGELSNLLQSRFSYMTHLLDSTFQLPVKVASSNSPTHCSNSCTIALRGPKFKASETRKQSFDLLTTLSANNLANLKIILEYIHPLILSGDWRTSNSKHWEIVPKKNEKSSTGYVGLKNLGCICYMNSLLQQLFMIPSFREDILKCKDIRFDQNQPEDNILLQLKCMFTSLCYSEKEAYNPKKFCHAFKDYEGNPTNVFEQMDIDEFFNALMDKLETQMKGTQHAEAIKNHFGGVLSNEIISKGCSHSSESEEAFLSLSLQVKNKKDIKQSLEALVQGEMLEGDNAYHCEKCNKKVNALKRTCLKKLPNHLILVLKRFEFNYDSMQKVKINQFCSFPEEIDFAEFSQQGLRKMQKNEDDNQAQLTKQNSTQQQQQSQQSQSQQQIPEQKDEYPESYFKYQLKGIVIHMGIADSGHYYSYIRERNGNSNSEAKWMEFNDNIVKPFDPKEIPNEAFGGEEKWKKHMNMMKNQYMMSALRQKIRNAYLLFYERIDPYETNPDISSIPPKISDQNNCSNENKDSNPNQNSPSERQDHQQEKQTQKNSINDGDQDNRRSEQNNNEFEEEQEDLKEQQDNTTKEADEEEKQKLDSENSAAQAQEAYCDRFKRELLAENTRFHLRRLIFTPQLPAFLYQLIHNYYVLKKQIGLSTPKDAATPAAVESISTRSTLGSNSFADNSAIPSEQYLIEFTATYFLTTAIRQRTQLLPLSAHTLELQAAFFYILHTQLAQSESGCEWLIRVFTDKQIVSEIICSPAERVRDYVAALIEQAVKCTGQLLNATDCIIEQNQVNNNHSTIASNNNSTAQLINCLVSCIGVNNSGAIIDVLWRITASNQNIAQYLADRSIIQRIIAYLCCDRLNKKNMKKNNNSSNHSTANPEAYLQFTSPTRPPIGHPSADQRTPKAFDLFMKKDKFVVHPPANLTSLFQLLSYLMLRSTIPQTHPSTIPSTLHHSLTYEEIEPIIRDPESVCTFMYTALDKGQIYHMSRILAYLAYEDFELSSNICIAAASIVNDKQCQEFCYAFCSLAQLCQIEDSLADKRIECALTRLIPSVEANLKYQKETDVCSQFILKIAYKSPRMAYQLQQNHQDFIDGLIKATTDFIPTKKEAEENCEKGLRNELQYYNIKMPRTLKELNSLRLWKLSQLEKLKAGESMECIDKEGFDSDAVMNESDYATGMLLDYFDDMQVKWSCVRVQQVDAIKRIVSVYELVEETVDFTPINHSQEILPAGSDQLLSKTSSKMEEERMQLVNSNEYKVHNLPIGSAQLYPYKQMSDNHAVPLKQFQLLPDMQSSQEHLQPQQQDQGGQQQQWTVHDGNLQHQDEEEKETSNIEEDIMDEGTGDQHYENNQGSYPHFEDFEETNQENDGEEEEDEEKEEEQDESNQEGEEDNVTSSSQQHSSTH